MMSQSNVTWAQLRPYLMAFGTHARLWMIPTAVFTLLAILYALTMPSSWRASQAILVRDEAVGSQSRQGQFDSIDRMKVFQETILEVARNRVVVESVLKRVGPPPNHREGDPWPTEQAIVGFQQAVGVSAPSGAEFGRTEIFFLSVTGSTPDEAIRRTNVLCDVLVIHLAELRDARAQSIVNELETKLQLAQTDLEHSTTQLEAMEREVGADLGELRLLNENGSGDSNLRTGSNQIEAELREVEKQRESLQQLHVLLEQAARNPDSLLATPSSLLDAQPALRRLKEGLVDAQLRCAQLRGRLSDQHPTVVAAVRTEKKIRADLHAEVETALRGVEVDIAANMAQTDRLEEQQADLQKRLDRLSGLRARYGNLVAEVQARSEIVDGVKQKLTEARSSGNTGGASSLLTRFHDPVVGDRPIGPSRKVIVGGGMAGGLALGAGLVFLFMPIGPTGKTRRWNDYVNMGRRATDRFFGRRASDMSVMPGNFPPAGPALTRTNGRRLEGRNGGEITVVGGRRESDIPTQPPAISESPNDSDRRRRNGRRADDVEA